MQHQNHATRNIRQAEFGANPPLQSTFSHVSNASPMAAMTTSTTAQPVRQSGKLHARFDRLRDKSNRMHGIYQTSSDGSRSVGTSRTCPSPNNNLHPRTATRTPFRAQLPGSSSMVVTSPRSHKPGQPLQQQMAGSNGVADESQSVPRYEIALTAATASQTAQPAGMNLCEQEAPLEEAFVKPTTHMSPSRQHLAKTYRQPHVIQHRSILSTDSGFQSEIMAFQTQVSPSREGIEENQKAEELQSDEDDDLQMRGDNQRYKVKKYNKIEVMSIDKSESTVTIVAPPKIGASTLLTQPFVKTPGACSATRYNFDDEESKYSHISFTDQQQQQQQSNLFSPGELHPKQNVRHDAMKKQPSLPPVARKLSNASSDGNVLRHNTIYTMKTEAVDQSECPKVPRLPGLDKNYSQIPKASSKLEQSEARMSQSPKKIYSSIDSFSPNPDQERIPGSMTMPNHRQTHDQNLFLSNLSEEQNSGFPVAQNYQSFSPSPNFLKEVKTINAQHDSGASGQITHLNLNQLLTVKQGNQEITLNSQDLIKLLLHGQQTQQPERISAINTEQTPTPRHVSFPDVKPSQLGVHSQLPNQTNSLSAQQHQPIRLTMADIESKEQLMEAQDSVDTQHQHSRKISFMNNNFVNTQRPGYASMASSDFTSEQISSPSELAESQKYSLLPPAKFQTYTSSNQAFISITQAEETGFQPEFHPQQMHDTPNSEVPGAPAFMTPNALKREEDGTRNIQKQSQDVDSAADGNNFLPKKTHTRKPCPLGPLQIETSVDEVEEGDMFPTVQFTNDKVEEDNSIHMESECLEDEVQQPATQSKDEDDDYEQILKQMQELNDLAPIQKLAQPSLPVNNILIPKKQNQINTAPQTLAQVTKLQSPIMRIESDSKQLTGADQSRDEDDDYAQMIKQIQDELDQATTTLPTLPTSNPLISASPLTTVKQNTCSTRVSGRNDITVMHMQNSSDNMASNEVAGKKQQPQKLNVTFDPKDDVPESDKNMLETKLSQQKNSMGGSLGRKSKNPFAGMNLDIEEQQTTSIKKRNQSNENQEDAKLQDIELSSEKVFQFIETPKSSQGPIKGFFQRSFCGDPERTLDRIDEDPSHENSNYMGNDRYDIESCTATSNRTYGYMRRQGLNGKSTEFKTGGLRNKHLRLYSFDLTSGNQCQFEQPNNTGNQEVDQISQFAYSHGIDPQIFIDQGREEQAQLSLEQMMRALTPKYPAQPQYVNRTSKLSSHQKLQQQLQTQQQQYNQDLSAFYRHEVHDIRRLIREMPSFMPGQPQFNQQDQDFFNQRLMDNLMAQQQIQLRHNRPQRRQTLNNLHSQLSPRNMSGGRDAENCAAEKITNFCLNEAVKHKAQIAILSMAQKRFLNNQDQQKARQINKIILILKQHEAMLEEISDMMRVFKKKIHFAFLFASPIMFQKKDKSFKYFPQLNFAQEYIKIRESISAAQVQINITKRQCTTESMQEVLAQKPIGLHFSGHGILNNQDMGKDFFEQHKGQGDFLVLENDKGGSQLVSRDQLKKMIRQNKCELEFVFVATCHSEFVGQIFQEAGAKHVICIVHDKEVKDDAVITFTDTFYSMIFEQNHTICTAFSQAQLSVEISFSRDEAKIFKLLLREEVQAEDFGRFSGTHSAQRDNVLHQTFGDHDETIRSSKPIRYNGKLHTCKAFGPFQKGRYNYVEHQIVHLQNKAPKMPKLMGRQKDMFRVIDKILNSKSSRLFNLIGWSGIGKSALVCSMLDYISERGLLKGGSIYFNARNMAMCEMFIRNFNQVLISENPSLFGIAKERDQMKHEPIKTLESILAKISIIEGDIVLVIDNAEELIINERTDFCYLISMMLARVSQLKILLTSQRLLQRTLEFKEEKIILSNLSSCQSGNLFKEVMGRTLEQAEINNLLNSKPDYEKYPEEKSKIYKTWYDHHLFTLLDGNPQSIILVASLCADPQKRLQLKQIYKMLTDSQLFKLLKEEGIEDSNLFSLRLSATLSFQQIEESDPESTDLLDLLGLLPGGISPVDLDYLWGKVTKQSRKVHQEAQNDRSAAGGNEPSFVGSQRSKALATSPKKAQQLLQAKQSSSAWRRAFEVLKKAKLAEEKQARRRAYNTQDDQTSKKTLTEPNEGSKHDETDTVDDIVIILPEIVRTYSEGRLEESDSDFFVSILAGWYKNQLHDIYVKNENIVFSSSNVSRKKNQAREFERLEENIKVFILRMQEQYQEQKYTGQDLRRDKRKKDEQILAEETSDISSLDDDEETCFAEELFSKSSSITKLPPTGTPDTIRHVSTDNQTQCPKWPQPQVASLQQARTTPNQAANGEARLFSDDDGIQECNLPQLREAYLAVSKKKETLEKYIDAMRPNKHPQYIEESEARARAYWRWAFEKIKKREVEQKHLQFQEANVQMVGGQNLDESVDSEQSEGNEDENFNAKIKAYASLPNRMERIEKRNTIRKQITQRNTLQIQIQRGSIKDTRQPGQVGYSRQTSRMSVYEKRMTVIRDKNYDLLTVEETTMIYYLVNLILYKQYNVANLLIKKHFLPMKKLNDIFKANVRRLQALSLYHMFTSEVKSNSVNPMSSQAQAEKQSRMQKIDRCLRRAEKQFKRAKCAWGLGLTYFQRAYMFVYQMDLEQPQGNDGLNTPSPLQRKNMSRSRQSGFNQIKLSDQAKSLFLEAAEQFKQVNHWRGLYNTYRQLEQLMSGLGAEYISTDQNPMKQERDRREYAEWYKKYLNNYDVQRFSDNVNTDLTIQRSGGDAISLMTEIVMHCKQNTKLFDDPEKIRGWHSEEKDSFCTSVSLSQVIEDNYELESQQTTPYINIIQDDDLSMNNIHDNDRRISNKDSEGLLALPLNRYGGASRDNYNSQRKTETGKSAKLRAHGGTSSQEFSTMSVNPSIQRQRSQNNHKKA